jgi:hypothetical protein
MERLERIAIAFDAALREAGKTSRGALGHVWPLLARAVLIGLFLWYLTEFVLALFSRGWVFSGGMLAVVLLALAVLLVRAGTKTKAEYDKIPAQDAPPAAPVRPYLYAVLLAVLAVWISAIWNMQYSTPLLGFTLKILEVFAL